MPAVLGIDLGKNLGFGLVGRGQPVSGIHVICKKWAPLGPNLLMLEDRLHSLIVKHKPDILATASQFVNLHKATTDNLIPIFSCFGVLNMLAAATGIPLMFTYEGTARTAFLGDGMVPQGTEKAKGAIYQGCLDRGWRACGLDASDALCVASWAHGKATPGMAHETTPLFQAAPTMRIRRPKRAA